MEKKLDVVVPIKGDEEFIQDLDAICGITCVFTNSGEEYYDPNIYRYTGVTVVHEGHTYYQFRAPRNNVYALSENPTAGDNIYNTSFTLTGYVNTAELYTDHITDENVIYSFHGRYYRRYGNDIVEVTDVEFPSLGKPMELFDFTYDSTRMGKAPSITATKMWGDWLDDEWKQEVHVHFNGEKYYLKLSPTSTKDNTDERYKYQLDFVSERIALEDVYFYDVVMPYATDRPVSEKSEFSFYGDIKELRKRLNASMVRSGISQYKKRVDENGFPIVPNVITLSQWNALPEDSPLKQEFEDYEGYLQHAYEYDSETQEFVIDGYQVVIGTDRDGNPLTSEEKLMQFSNNTIYEALEHIKEDYGLQYFVQSGTKNIVIGDNEYDFTEDMPFQYGVTNELLSVEKSNSTEKVVTSITGVGSSDNIPYYYPNPTPDGWIEPLYKRHSTVLSNIVEYDEDDEKYLRNRIGRGFLFGRLRGKLELGVDNTIDLTNATTPQAYSTRIASRSEYSDLKVALKFSLTERSRVEFRNICTTLPNAQIFKIEIQTPVANPYYDEAFVQQWNEILAIWQQDPEAFSYNQNTVGTYVVNYQIPQIFDIPADYTMDLTQVPQCWYVKLSPYVYGTTATYTSRQDLQSWTNNTHYLEKNDYRIVYHVNGNVDMPLGVITPSGSGLQDTWLAYESPEEIVILTDGWHPSGEPSAERHAWGYACPMLFSKFAYLKPHFNTTTHTWEWYPDGYQDFAYWKMIMQNTYGITVGSSNYKLATKQSALTGHPYKSDETPQLYDRRSYTYVFRGLEWYELDYENCEKTLDRDNLTLGLLYNQYMYGRIIIYHEKWYRDNQPVEYGLYCTFYDHLGREVVDPTLYHVSGGFIENGVTYTAYSNGTRTTYTKTPSPVNATDVFNRSNLTTREGYVRAIYFDYYGLTITGGAPVLFDEISFRRLRYKIPQPNLMPELFIRSDGERRFYPAHNYDPVVETVVDEEIGEEFVDRWVQIGQHFERQYGTANDLYKDDSQDKATWHYHFETEYAKETPHEHVENFDDIKPSLTGQRYNGLRIDVVEKFDYDKYDDSSIWETGSDGSGEYKHPHFFAKLRPMGFNIFDMALEEDMVISMTSGHCGACQFKIKVDENTKKNPVQVYASDVYVIEGGNYVLYKAAGELQRWGDPDILYVRRANGTYTRQISTWVGRTRVTGDTVESGELGSLPTSSSEHIEGDVKTAGRFQETQQDTTDNYVWVALEKDTSTYGVLMPSALPHYEDLDSTAYIRPTDVQMAGGEEGADKFVLLNIKMPQRFYRAAEHELARKLVTYMYDNNYQKYNFTIKFSRIYLETNPNILAHLNENCLLYVKYNRPTAYRQYVSHFTYKMSHNEPLPEITVDMNRELSVVKTLPERVQDVTEVVRTGREETVGVTAGQPLMMASASPSHYITDYGYHVITGDIYSEEAGVSFTEVAVQTAHNTDGLIAVNDRVDTIGTGKSQVEGFVATHHLLNTYGKPFTSLRFKQWFPDDVIIPTMERNVLPVECDGKGNIHIYGEITQDAGIVLWDDVRNNPPFTSLDWENNHYYAVCFLSQSGRDVFRPIASANFPPTSDRETRYLGASTYQNALQQIADGIHINHTNGDEPTKVDITLRIRVYDLTEMFGYWVAANDDVTAVLKQYDVFKYDYIRGERVSSRYYQTIDEPFVDYPDTKGWTILHQQGYKATKADFTVSADYSLLATNYSLPSWCNGLACIVDADDTQADSTKYDNWLNEQDIKHNIYRVELSTLSWRDDHRVNGFGYRAAKLPVVARQGCKTVLCPIALTFDMGTTLMDYNMCIHVETQRGDDGLESWIALERNLFIYDIIQGETQLQDGTYVYTNLYNVYAEFLLEEPIIERRT